MQRGQSRSILMERERSSEVADGGAGVHLLRYVVVVSYVDEAGHFEVGEKVHGLEEADEVVRTGIAEREGKGRQS